MELNKKEKDWTYYNPIKFRDLDYSKISLIHKFIVDNLNIKKDTRILDVGCGIGRLAHQLHAVGYLNYTGIDFSKYNIRIARKNIVVNNYSFLIRNVNDPIDDLVESSDIIIAVEILEHLNNDILFLKNIAKKPIIFSVPNFDAEAHVRFFLDANEVEERYGFIKDTGSLLIRTIQGRGERKFFIAYYNINH